MQETSQRIRQGLAAVAWLRAAGDVALDALAANARLEHVAGGSSVALRGRPATHLIVVVEGALELSMTSATGKRHVINWTAPGQAFGLIPLLDDMDQIHDAVAHGACQLVRVPKERFRAAMREHPQLNDQVLRLLCARSRGAYESLAAQTLASLTVRLARMLLGQLKGSSEQQAAITLPQADLADMLGVTRQSLNLELRQLEREGIVELGRLRITLRDRVRLEALAGSVD